MATVQSVYGKMIEKIDPALMRAKVKQTASIVRDPELQEYMEHHSLRPSKALEELNASVMEHPMGALSSSRDESQFLAWLVSSLKARRVIEVGVFLGYTTMAIAQELPEDGKIVALDLLAEFTSVGEKHWKNAGLDKRIDLRIAPAVDSLAAMVNIPSELNSYDFAFIDADKSNYDNYYEQCLKLIRPGGVIAIDNVFWSGRVLKADDTSVDTVVIKALNDKIHKDQRVAVTMLAIADGLTLCRKL